jgi:methyl-accepting chemotaxis protein
MGNLRRYEKDMILSYEDPDQVEAYRAKWQQTLEQADAVMERMRALGEGRDGSKLQAMKGHVQAYAEAAAPVVRQLVAGGYDTATVANRLLGRAKDSIRQSEALMEQLAADIATESAAARDQGEATAQSTLWLFGLALAAAVALVVPLTLANMVSICQPIAQARALAERIAAGDLTSRIQVQGRDEGAALQSALLRMQQTLAQLVGQVRDSAESISVASGEVASGNADLSSRTEQTASSLQQTASSMEQITGSVRNSAESARQASSLADSAASVAERGGAAVAEVVATMGHIQASSQRIADIIGTIDGIAFQTNILALNAAVEAARAGEQGRGFAVVASEVRALAQRSAEAAKQIKGLIGTSVERVGEGSRQVQQAGQTMAQIVDSVKRVTQMIGEITHTANEQSQGIGSVNGAVTELDRMTQQNAALVEQSAAAAESLKDQAQRLQGVIAGYRVG